LIDREVWVDVFYKGEPIAKQRIGTLVSHSVVVERTTTVPPFSRRQLLNYLRATPLELGLLLDFGPEPEVYRLIDTEKR
jgi:GxxExxY protein